ncbi:MAG: glycosyltransferase family 2 protein [bacterium]|nr:glycosyltransferase family 2 protein [bacterium]
MNTFSILIPTYNRKEKLKKVLEAVAQQMGIENGEVVVGIDGSSDGTEEYVRSLAADFPAALRYFFISNSGRAVVRNRLLEAAKGDIILFIQDDIIVTPGWLEAHLDFHRRTRGALVGFITWYPEANITPYMRWLEDGGHLLRFKGLSNGTETDFWHFYTGNISFPSDLVSDLRFDESFQGYGWEDILFGYEFARRGRKVYYSSSAKVYHWDEYREEDLEAYMTRVAQSARLAEKKHPRVGFVPPCWKKALLFFSIWLSRPLWFLLPRRWKWYLHMKQTFLRALKAPYAPAKPTRHRSAGS